MTIDEKLHAVNALDGTQTVAALAVLAEEMGLVGVAEELSQAALDPGPLPPVTGDPLTEPELARLTLGYLVGAERPLADVAARAVDAAADGDDRLDPFLIPVGGLVLALLQTELNLERSEDGRWRFRLHKQQMRDASLVKIVTEVFRAITK